MTLSELKFNEAGLIPVIVQDATSGQVLMLAWANADSLRLMQQSGETWFWSRSRQELWHKGATSGNTQKVRRIYFDCDGDTLLVQVDAAGPACHTGAVSCFFRELPNTEEP
ncbi:MAG: phosphoribosyl-AMP cyclohydrolase [Anaerolineae bacterium]